MTYLQRAYQVVDDLGLTDLTPHDRNELVVAFSEALEEAEADVRRRAGTYMRSMAELIDPQEDEEDERREREGGMTDLDTLLAQALALVSEDRRGELADVIEEIVTAPRRDGQEDIYKLACRWCRAGRPIAPAADGDWLHPSVTDDPDEWEWCQSGYMRQWMAQQEAASHAP